jgi:hypothetical protein
MNVHTKHPGANGQTSSDIIAVADIGNSPAGKRAHTTKLIDHRQEIGKSLKRMSFVGKHVDDRDRTDGGHSFQFRVFEDPSTDRRVIAAQRPRHVFDALASIESNLVWPDCERVATELNDRHFHRVARSRRWLLEKQRHTEAIEASWHSCGPTQVEYVHKFSC